VKEDGVLFKRGGGGAVDSCETEDQESRGIAGAKRRKEEKDSALTRGLEKATPRLAIVSPKSGGKNVDKREKQRSDSQKWDRTSCNTTDIPTPTRK